MTLEVPAVGPGSEGERVERVRTGADVIDDVLTGQARLLPPTTVERLGRQIVQRLDPDRAERFNADSYERRSCSWTRDFADMGLYRLILDPATDVLVQAAIAQWSTPLPAGTATTLDGRTITVRDTRTTGQRRADAVAALILTGAGLRPATTDAAATTTAADAAATTTAADAAATTTAADAAATGTADAAATADGEEPDHDTSGAPDHRRDDRPEPEPEQAAGREERAAGRGERGARGLPAGVFLARPTAGVHVSVIATLDQFAAAFGACDPAARTAGLARIGLAGQIGDFPGATLQPAVLARLACDGPVHRILVNARGVPLRHGRNERFATPAQRRALAARDAGCVIPGCPAPPEWCEAHHIIPWEHGGLTDIDDMVLLCGRHHTAHHAGTYPISMRDGVPWVRLPGWHDITRPWARNATCDHHRLANTTARTITRQPTRPPDVEDETPEEAA
jgi:hypothetical protein